MAFVNGVKCPSFSFEFMNFMERLCGAIPLYENLHKETASTLSRCQHISKGLRPPELVGAAAFNLHLYTFILVSSRFQSLSRSEYNLFTEIGGHSATANELNPRFLLDSRDVVWVTFLQLSLEPSKAFFLYICSCTFTDFDVWNQWSSSLISRHII